MAKITRTLHLMHCSMRFDRPPEEFKDAIRWMHSLEPDIVSFTEMTRFHKELRQVCQGTRYRPVLSSRGKEGGFMVKTGDECHVKDSGAVFVLPGNPGPASQGGYAPRYVNWVRVKWHGEDIYHHTTHWLTKYWKNDARDALHEKSTKVMCDLVKRHGKGMDLAFFGGDQNVDEEADNRKMGVRSQMDKTFRDNGLLTIWDEMEVTPPTHGLSKGPTIDILGSFNPDKRVKAKRWKVYPKHASDHRPIAAWYEIQQTRQAGVGGSNTGGGKNDPTPKKGFVTGGNVDFSDYRDGSVYPLPYAIDDSDLTNG